MSSQLYAQSFFSDIAGTSGLDGIWTGHDWTSSEYGIKVVNGVPGGANDEMKRRIESTATF